ncbi:MAG: biotin-dependent carboxyltransferase family protein [Dermatophilaceae bacterium]
MTGTLTVIDPGPMTTVQDLGRPGHGAIGVPTGGAADRASLRLANRLLGQADATPGLETTLGGLRVRFGAATRCCVAGAPCEVRIDGAAAAFGEAILVPGGAELALGTPRSGLRSYLAVAGGLSAPVALGSVASSPSLALGRPPLRAGDTLALGEAAPYAPHLAHHPGGAWQAEPTATIVRGPRTDWFDRESSAALTSDRWTATGALDRIGVRLDGPPIRRATAYEGKELPSEPMVRGSIQVPPDGQPVVLLADHPTTGGYPVIAVVTDADTDRVAQLRPGDPVRFRAVPPPWR